MNKKSLKIPKGQSESVYRRRTDINPIISEKIVRAIVADDVVVYRYRNNVHPSNPSFSLVIAYMFNNAESFIMFFRFIHGSM
jgi:uncharacterized protein YukJ